MKKNPKCFYALYDAKGEPVTYSPYKLGMEQRAQREGLRVVVISQGCETYDKCLAAWNEYIGADNTSAQPNPAYESAAKFHSDAPPTGSDIEAQARREWDQSMALQGEFRNFSVYLAWKKADASGLATITTGKVISDSIHPNP